MTLALPVTEVVNKIEGKCPGSLVESDDNALIVKNEALYDVAEYLKNAPEFDFDFLNFVTAVDYPEYFEVVYYLLSLGHNHRLVLKTRLVNKDNPSVCSVVSLWSGADFQEREIYDLMGINFEGHPNLKRIMLWEGFQGHPLRKDYKINGV